MRTGGVNINKCDVTYTSPSGKVLRSKIGVEKYCLENDLEIDLSLLKFSHRMTAEEISNMNLQAVASGNDDSKF